jgi:hypothetical protein
MKDILFVVDERELPDSLRARLYKHLQDWNMKFVVSGAGAIAALERQHVDVIVSDVRKEFSEVRVGDVIMERLRNFGPSILQERVRVMTASKHASWAAKSVLPSTNTGFAGSCTGGISAIQGFRSQGRLCTVSQCGNLIGKGRFRCHRKA